MSTMYFRITERIILFLFAVQMTFQNQITDSVKYIILLKDAPKVSSFEEMKFS